MAKNKIYRVKMRRRRNGKTNYRIRLSLLKSGKIRAVVRRTNKRLIVQFVEYKEDGDKILVAVSSDALKKYGWDFSYKNIPAAYLVGYLAGKMAVKRGFKEAILDIGYHYAHHGSRIFAVLKGLVDAGVDIPYNENVFPTVDRLTGQHINNNIEKLFTEIKSKMEV